MYIYIFLYLYSHPWTRPMGELGLAWVGWGVYFRLDTFPIIVFVLTQFHKIDGELLSSVPSVEFRHVSFSCFQEPAVSTISNDILLNTHKYTYCVINTHEHF